MGILDNMKIMDKINGRTEVKNDPLTMAQQSIASAEAEIGKNLADLGRLIFELEEKGSEELLKIKEQNTEYNNLVDRVNKAKANKEAFYKNYLQLQGLMECINCKRQIHFGSIYCSNCGQKLEKGSDFCTNCGTKINGGE